MLSFRASDSYGKQPLHGVGPSALSMYFALLAFFRGWSDNVTFRVKLRLIPTLQLLLDIYVCRPAHGTCRQHGHHELV